MLIKPGVDISRLNRAIRRTLPTLDRIYRNLNSELVITSTYEGTHVPGSLHYANDAIDIRFPERAYDETIDKISTELGKAYDCLKSTNCIHIEYDPKT